MNKKLIWTLDKDTIEQLSRCNPFNLDLNAKQFKGFNFSSKNWTKYLGDKRNIETISSPGKIIEAFQNKDYLLAIALVVSWGLMWRNPQKIIGERPHSLIVKKLQECEKSIIESNNIKDAWVILTGDFDISIQVSLGWSPVMASKTLHFLCRSLGYDDNPPVAIDNAVMKQKAWPAFIKNCDIYSKPKHWHSNQFEAYQRYMSMIIALAEKNNCSTTIIEAALFKFYEKNKNLKSPPSPACCSPRARA